LATLAFALGVAASGCVASAAEIDAQDEAATEADPHGQDGPTLKTKLEERSTGHAETVSAEGTAGIPATPDPSEPQPSPWKPNGTSLSAPSDPAGTATTGTPGTAGTSPTTTPQPSPWGGHVPPPIWPNVLPAEETNAQ
jgi:hypothetical protein